MTHTPTPWAIDATNPHTIIGKRRFADGVEELHVIAALPQNAIRGGDPREANAVFIVEACNTHGTLKDAITRLDEAYIACNRESNRLREDNLCQKREVILLQDANQTLFRQGANIIEAAEGLLRDLKAVNSSHNVEPLKEAIAEALNEKPGLSEKAPTK
jgi:hypothetical protein